MRRGFFERIGNEDRVVRFPKVIVRQYKFYTQRFTPALHPNRIKQDKNYCAKRAINKKQAFKTQKTAVFSRFERRKACCLLLSADYRTFESRRKRQNGNYKWCDVRRKHMRICNNKGCALCTPFCNCIFSCCLWLLPTGVYSLPQLALYHGKLPNSA